MKKLITAAFLAFGLATVSFSAPVTPNVNISSAVQSWPPLPGQGGGYLWPPLPGQGGGYLR